LEIKTPSTSRTVAHYHVQEGLVRSASIEKSPPAAKDRLYLVNAAGFPEFREVYDGLLAMGFYNVNPEVMRVPQNPDANELLHHDGANIASVVARLQKDQPRVAERIKKYLSTIVPGITEVIRAAWGPSETLQFSQNVEGAAHPWRFYAASMSDGTLRALGTLIAVMQLVDRKKPVRLVGIEEPETALHPAAAGALMDALREASMHTQVLVTTHSPDLVDQIDPENDKLLAVQTQVGTTEIGRLDTASLEAIKKHLYSPGELLKMDQLQIDPKDLEQQERQMKLFGLAEDGQ
jgi:predicted ATPase